MHDGDPMVYAVLWAVGTLTLLLAVWLVVSYKLRRLRRRQRRFYRAFERTQGKPRCACQDRRHPDPH